MGSQWVWSQKAVEKKAPKEDCGKNSPAQHLLHLVWEGYFSGTDLARAILMGFSCVVRLHGMNGFPSSHTPRSQRPGIRKSDQTRLALAFPIAHHHPGPKQHDTRWFFKKTESCMIPKIYVILWSIEIHQNDWYAQCMYVYMIDGTLMSTYWYCYLQVSFVVFSTI